MSDAMALVVALVVAPFAGLVFGSFASLAGYRLPRGLGVVAGRSRCPACDATLGGARSGAGPVVGHARRALPPLRRGDRRAVSA